MLTLSREVADYFEAVARESGNAKAASNWVMTEVLRKLKDDERPLAAMPRRRPPHLAELIRLVDAGTISGKTAKDVFEKMWATGERARGHRGARGAGPGLRRGAPSRPRSPR